MSPSTPLKVGVLVPQGNTVHAREFEALKPPGVAFAFQAFGYPPQSPDFCVDLAENMRAPLAALADWGAKVVLVGCTTASMACVGEAFTRKLEAIAGVPVVTAAEAAREAMAALEARALSVATPYGALNNGIIQAFVESSGGSVAAMEGLDLDRSVEVWLAGQPTLTPDFVYDLSCRVDRDDAEGLYLPCTGMGSIEAIDRFEKSHGKPAFSSVQAGYWAALRRAGFDGRQAGAGRLIEQWDF